MGFHVSRRMKSLHLPLTVLLCTVGLLACNDLTDHSPQTENAANSQSKSHKLNSDEVALSLSSPMFTGDYQDVGVQIGSDVSCSFDELTFKSTSPADSFSKSKDESFDPSNPTVRLLLASKPGDYEMRALCNGTQVGTETYEIAGTNTNEDVGPGMWLADLNSSVCAQEKPPLIGEVHDDCRVDPVQTPRKTLAVMIETQDHEWENFSDRREFWKKNIEGAGYDDTEPYDGYFSVDRHFQELFGRSTAGIDVTIPDYPVKLDTTLDAAIVDDVGELDKEWGPVDWGGNVPQIVNAMYEADRKDDGDLDHPISDYDIVQLIFKDEEVPGEARVPDNPVEKEDDPSTMCDGIDNDNDGAIDEQDTDMKGIQCEDYNDGKADTCGNGWVDDYKDSDGNFVEECDDGNLEKYDNCRGPEVRDSLECEFQKNGVAGPSAQKRWKTPSTEVGHEKAAFVTINDRWNARGGDRAHATLTHEYGHAHNWTYDLYNSGDYDGSRTLYNRTFMAKAGRHPNATAKFRLEQNFIGDPKVKVIDTRTTTGTISETFTMRPIETMDAPSGQYLVAQVFLGRYNYLYLAYRLGQYDEMSDQMDPFGQEQDGDLGHIMMTDYAQKRKKKPSDQGQWLRNIVEPVDTKGNDVGLLGEGEEFTMNISPSKNPPQVHVKVDDLEEKSDYEHEATVTVEVDGLDADPAIRDWNREASGWKSPDLMIRNERTKEGSANEEQWDKTNGFYPGGKNSVVARVHNVGEKKADDVYVQFQLKDFNASPDNGGEVIWEGESEVKDVPVTHTTDPVEFKDDIPREKVPEKGHFCIEAKVKTDGVDMDNTNNLARSNHKGDWSGSASPAERRTTEVELTNVYSEEVTYYLNLTQTHDHFRAYLEHRWVTVPAGETRTVDVQYEYSEDFPTMYQEFENYEPRNLVSVQSHVIPPDTSYRYEDGAGESVSGGAQIRVFAGFQTKQHVEEFTAENENIYVQVWRPHDGEGVEEGGVEQGEVLVTVRRADGAIDSYRAEPYDPGQFAVPVDLQEWEEVDVQYLGRYPNNPTDIQTFVR